MRFTDQQFQDAVLNTKPQRGQIESISKIVGCSRGTVVHRLRKLEAAGVLELTKHKTYDSQPDPWGQGLFGGAGACVRRYLIVDFVTCPRCKSTGRHEIECETTRYNAA